MVILFSMYELRAPLYVLLLVVHFMRIGGNIHDAGPLHAAASSLVHWAWFGCLASRAVTFYRLWLCMGGKYIVILLCCQLLKRIENLGCISVELWRCRSIIAVLSFMGIKFHL